MSDFHSFRKTLEEKRGLWDNIHAKRQRGEKMRKPGSEGAPTDQDFKNAQKKESVDEAYKGGNMHLINKIKNSGVVKTGSMSKDKSVEPKKVETKKEDLDIQEISLDMLTKKISNSGMASTKKANKFDKTKNDLKAMRDRLNDKKPLTLAKEAKEDDEPASPDESSMAMQQLEFIEYAAEEMMDHIKAGNAFPEWFQNKLSKAHGEIEGLHSSMGEHGEDDEEEDEEEDVKEAVRRKGAPKMTGDSFKQEREKSKAHDIAMGRTATGRKKPDRQMTSTQKWRASANEDVMSADRKPEKYIKPDGKVGIRMARTDKSVVSKDK